MLSIKFKFQPIYSLEYSFFKNAKIFVFIRVE